MDKSKVVNYSVSQLVYVEIMFYDLTLHTGILAFCYFVSTNTAQILTHSNLALNSVTEF